MSANIISITGSACVREGSNGTVQDPDSIWEITLRCSTLGSQEVTHEMLKEHLGPLLYFLDLTDPHGLSVRHFLTNDNDSTVVSDFLQLIVKSKDHINKEPPEAFTHDLIERAAFAFAHRNMPEFKSTELDDAHKAFSQLFNSPALFNTFRERVRTLSNGQLSIENAPEYWFDNAKGSRAVAYFMLVKKGLFIERIVSYRLLANPFRFISVDDLQ